MDAVRMVQAFSSGSPEYHRSFKIFLEHTDQKAKALEWLRGRVEQLVRRERLIDAGAGNGMLTSWLADRFGDVIAIEPNSSLVSISPPAVAVLKQSIQLLRLMLFSKSRF